MLDQQRVTRIKGNVFARPDWFKTDVATGVTRTPVGERICSLTDDFLLGFYDAIAYECGPAVRTVMKSAGKRWGVHFIQRLDKTVRELYQCSLRELQPGIQWSILQDAFHQHGWGHLKIDWSRQPELISVELENSIYPDLILQAEHPSDDLFAGLLLSIFEYLEETTFEIIQTECPTRDASSSKFVLAAPGTIQEMTTEFTDRLGQEGTHREILTQY